MQLIIHRKKKDGNANSVELRTNNSRILLSLDMPFTPDKAKDVGAILISHLSLNHYTCLKDIDQTIPIYMSRTANELINISNTFTANNDCKPNISTVKHMRPFQIGGFKIIAYSIDNSLLSTLAFSIEAGGKKIFYLHNTGNDIDDISVKRILQDHPHGLDYLIIAGAETMGEARASNHIRSLRSRTEAMLRQSENITFFVNPSDDIESIISVYNACSRTGSIFVMDIYTVFLLDKLRKISKDIPKLDWKYIKIRFIKSQVDILSNAGYSTLLYAYNKHKIDLFDINRHKKNILMLVRDDLEFTHTIKDIDRVSGARLISTSQKDSVSEKLKGYCEQKGIEIECIPTDTHKKTEPLKMVVNALSPKAIIPIQTSQAVKYSQLFSDISIMDKKGVIDIQ